MPVQQSSYSIPRMDLGVAFMEYLPSVANDFIGTRVLAPLGVSKKAAVYPRINRESFLKRSDAKIARGGSYPRIEYTVEDSQYLCEKYGFEEVVLEEDVDFYGGDFDAELVASQQIGLRLLIEQEIRVAAAVFNTTTFTGASLYTDWSNTAPWDAAASDVINHVIAAKEKVRLNTGLKPNSLIIGAATLANLLNNTGIKARFPGITKLTEDVLSGSMAAIFGLEQLIVGGQIYDSAKEGQTFSGADIWADDYAMVARIATANAPLNTPCIGRTFIWETNTPGNFIFREYEEPQVDGKVLKVRQFCDEVNIDTACGHLLKIDA